MSTSTEANTNLNQRMTSADEKLSETETDRQRGATAFDGDDISMISIVVANISQWSEDEVLGWFQSYKLDRLYDTLIAPFDAQKDGAMLEEIFNFERDIRDRVSEIAEKLCKEINQDGKQRVFYDKYYKAKLARPNLDLYLHNIYRYQSRLTVVFMCEDYLGKEWCGLEARSIRSLRKMYQNDRIMLLSVDGTVIDGVLDIDGYWDISEEK
ncbi:hypothetical protein I4U23_015838 [Adineta vaga]|nr:hypothetical protein I4U23_015838 [Adineta vaga]